MTNTKEKNPKQLSKPLDPSEPMSRRDFLKLCGAGLAGMLLNACGLVPKDQSNPYLTVSKTPDPTEPPTSTPTSTPTETPTPIIEPTQTPPPEPNLSSIHPPENFNQLPQVVNQGVFDTTDAHAVYAYYRQQNGPRMWPDNDQFIHDMQEYYQNLEKQGVSLVEADGEGISFSLLAKKDPNGQGVQILLGFTPDGALAHTTPGLWGKDINQQWINVNVDGAKDVKLVTGPDNLPYIVALDDQGNALAFFNAIGANRDNLDKQWIGIDSDGYPQAIWNGQEFISKPSFIGVIGACTNNPEVTQKTGRLSCDQVTAYPTPIQIKDLLESREGGGLLGVKATILDADGKIYGYWVVGKIVHVQFEPNFNGKHGYIHQVLDVPTPTGYFRVYTCYYNGANQGPSSHFLIGQVAENIQQLRQSGINPFAGVTLRDILLPHYSYPDKIQGFRSLRMQDIYDAFKADPNWWVGQPFGGIVPAEVTTINPEDPNATGGNSQPIGDIFNNLTGPKLPDSARRFFLEFAMFGYTQEGYEHIINSKNRR